MKKAAIAVAAVLIAALAVFVFYDGVLNKTSEADFFSMKTYVTAKVTGYESDLCTAEIQKIVDNLDVNILSRTAENSLVSLLNKNGGGELDEACNKCLRIKVSNKEALARVLDELKAEYKIISHNEADIYGDISISLITSKLLQQGCEVLSIQNHDESLESFYINLVGGEDNG